MAFDSHADFAEPNSNCHNSDSDTSKNEAAQSRQNKTGEHNHCLLHCAHLAATTLVSQVEFTFVVFKDTLNTQYLFNLSFPILDGPFRPPQA